MSLPNSLIKRLEARKSEGLPVGFSPWSDLDGMLWGNIRRVGQSEIEFDLVHVDGSFDETRSYNIARIYQFDFDIEYATRLRRLGERQWTKGRGTVVRSASERNEILQRALTSGAPIYCRYYDEDCFYDALVIELDGDWVTLQRLEDDGTSRNEIEVTRRSKISIKAGPFDEAMAWLVSTALGQGMADD